MDGMKKRSETIIQVEENASSGYLNLPYNQQQFRDFINSLLGTPQAIVKYYPGGFTCDANVIRDIFHLFENRITMQQHNSFLAKFYGTLYLDDDSEIEFSEFEQMATYSHLGPEVCTMISMVMQYVIYNRKGAPEKQSIQVTFYAPRETKEHDFTRYDEKSSPDFTGVELRVETTDRTWAQDMSSLFSSYMAPRITKIPKYAKIVNRYGLSATSWISILLFIFPLFRLTFLLISPNMGKAKTSYDNLLSRSDIESLSKKIDILLMSTFDTGFHISKPMVYLCLGATLFLIITIFRPQVAKFLLYRNYGYILFSEESRKNMAQQEKKNSRGKFYLINFVFITVVLGVITNFIYDIIKGS